MNKQLLAALAVLIIVIFGIFLLTQRDGSLPVAPAPATTTAGASTATTTPTPATTTVKSIITSIFKPTAAVFDPRDPWQVLAKYFSYAKAHDIAGIKSLSYQQSTACSNAKKQEECFALIDGVYAFKDRLKPDLFPEKREDAKQLALLGPIVKDDSLGYGYKQGIIIFTKTAAGELRLLTFNPDRGWYLMVDSADQNIEGHESRVRTMMEDADQDLKDDREEACVGEADDCVITDVTKRDTDGDGWWDGVEKYFYK